MTKRMVEERPAGSLSASGTENRKGSAIETGTETETENVAETESENERGTETGAVTKTERGIEKETESVNETEMDPSDVNPIIITTIIKSVDLMIAEIIPSFT